MSYLPIEVCSKSIPAMEWAGSVVKMFLIHTQLILISTVHECLMIFSVLSLTPSCQVGKSCYPHSRG